MGTLALINAGLAQGKQVRPELVSIIFAARADSNLRLVIADKNSFI